MELLTPCGLALLGAIACYAPELHDCITACEADADCAPGQACGGDRLCAAPANAGRCAMTDARLPDAAPGDGAPTPGPTAKVVLRVRIHGDGVVVVVGIGSCDSRPVHRGDCTYAVAAGVPLTLRAIPRADQVFEQWSSTACADQGPTCSLVVVAPLTEARARFHRNL